MTARKPKEASEPAKSKKPMAAAPTRSTTGWAMPSGLGRRLAWGTRVGGRTGRRRACGLAGVANVVLLHLAVERGPIEAEDLRRFLLVPVGPLQRLQNGHLLDFRQGAVRRDHEIGRARRLFAD